jgi:hypothetical protein
VFWVPFLPIEIQSWGYSLAQAANRHLGLANEGTQQFESPMPKKAFEFGMKNGNLLEHGRIQAPGRTGSGYRRRPAQSGHGGLFTSASRLFVLLYRSEE